MKEMTDVSPTIVETLYLEALVLADEARAAFDLSGRLDAAAFEEDMSRLALSSEALRTTTRMMHAIAWLLNRRAYFAGELTDFQLHCHGRLPPPESDDDPEQLALLDPELLDLVGRTKRFYARIARLDRSWSDHVTVNPSAVHRLHERLGSAVGTL